MDCEFAGSFEVTVVRPPALNDDIVGPCSPVNEVDHRVLVENDSAIPLGCVRRIAGRIHCFEALRSIP